MNTDQIGNNNNLWANSAIALNLDAPLGSPDTLFVNPANGHIYFLTDPTLGRSWTEAQAQAVASGGNLVTINDSAEQAWLNKTFGTSESLWIGLYDPQRDNTDEWVSGEPVTYTNWAPREPNSRDEQYGELNPAFSPGKWNDRAVFPSQFGGRGIVEVIPKEIDLDVGTITLPSNGVSGQNATIEYTVENTGQDPVILSWYDSIYLSIDDQWDLNDPLFERVAVSDPLNSGASYTKAITGSLPGVLPGDYHVIVRSDIRNNLIETNENNNLSVSPEQITIDIDALDLGVSRANILEQGQSIYYRVDVPADRTLLVTLDSKSETALNELYISFNKIPTRTDFDFAPILPLSPDQRVAVPLTEAGTYYISAFGNTVLSGTASFDIKAELVDFAVLDNSYGRGGNAGNLTIEINGAGFDRTVKARLTDGAGVNRTAVNMFPVNEAKAFSTFDLIGLAPGKYDVVVENADGANVTVNDGLEVVESGGGIIRPEINAPSAVARNRRYSFNTTWSNDGLNDATVPLLLVENTVPFGFAPGGNSAGSSYTFLGINTEDGPPGILRPGQSENITLFSFSDLQVGEYTVSVDRLLKDLAVPFDWDSLRPQLKPIDWSDEEFQPFFEQLIAQVGITNGDYLKMLSHNASLVPDELGSNQDVSKLLDLELRKAKAAKGTSISGSIFAKDFDVDLSGRTVIATNINTAESLSTITLNDGSFIFETLTPGTYTFEVQSEILSNQSPVVDVLPDRAISGLILNVDNGATVQGLLTNSSTNKPLKNAFISIFKNEQVSEIATSDSNGNYSISGLTPGNYTLTFEAEGLARTWSEDINITTDNLTVDASLIAESKITGTITDSMGTPLNDVLVFAQLQNDLPNTIFVSQPINGTFEIDSLSSGFYNITVVNGSSAPIILEDIELSPSSNLDLGTIQIPTTLNQSPGFLERQTPQTLVDADPLDILESVTAPLVIKAASKLGNEEAGKLFKEYFNSTGFNSVKQINDNSYTSITNAFKNHPLTQEIVEKIQSEVFAFAKNQWYRTLPCDHAEINDSIFIDSIEAPLIFPSKSLLSVVGALEGETSSPELDRIRDQWQYKTGAPGIVAGGVGSWGPPGSPAPEQRDGRFIDGFVNLKIPAGSNQAIITFDLNVKVVDAIDFAPGFTGIVALGGIPNPPLLIAEILEKKGHAFDVPFVVSFKAITPVRYFTVPLEKGNCDPPDPPDDKDPIRRPVSIDPNDIFGPDGFGDRGWIAAPKTLDYTIRFENLETAAAPAQQVTITHPLDPDLDLSTFQLGSFNWGDFFFKVPDNQGLYFKKRFDFTSDRGFLVDVEAGVDIGKREAFWAFTTIDPETGDLPDDPFVGFLPPTNVDGVGDGFVTYTIRPNLNVQTGDKLDAQASIVFDVNKPISTPPIVNTIDINTPTSSVSVLPATVTDPNFTVSWSGTDEGSGIAFYDIYAAVDGGNYQIWLDNTTNTSATYNGALGHTYSFYSVAQDNVGYIEAVPTTADTITVVNSSPIAGDDTVTANQSTTKIIPATDLLFNDSDPDGDPLTIVSVTNATSGFVELNANGDILYKPGSNYISNASFEYTVSDGKGGMDIATVTVTVGITRDGTAGNNTISGTAGDDDLKGLAGDDFIEGLAGNDSLDGGAGNFDRIFGGDGNDTITDPDGVNGAHGGAGNDIINVTFAASWRSPSNQPRSDGKITGGFGDDNITVTMNNASFFLNAKGDEPASNQPQDGNDMFTLKGIYANSVIDLGGGNDTFNGGSGNDNVSGKGGNDAIFGFNGNDQLAGNDGDDLLRGGSGKDKLIGGNGSDIFALAKGEGIDTIVDFQVELDFIGLADGLTFGQLSIIQSDQNSPIRNGEETLAILNGITASDLTPGMFVSI